MRTYSKLMINSLPTDLRTDFNNQFKYLGQFEVDFKFEISLRVFLFRLKKSTFVLINFQTRTSRVARDARRIRGSQRLWTSWMQTAIHSEIGKH